MAIHVLLDHGVLPENIVYYCLTAAPQGVLALVSLSLFCCLRCLFVYVMCCVMCVMVSCVSSLHCTCVWRALRPV
jgi:hypothetical protein